MKTSHKAIAMGGVGISLFLVLALLVGLLPLITSSNKLNVTTIEYPHAFATPEGAKTGAAFVTIKNGTANDDLLIGVSSDIARVTEIHQNVIDPDDGTMMMRKIKALDLPAYKTVKMTPTGYHIMLIDLNKRLHEAEYFKLWLTFKNSGTHQAAVFVVPPGGAKKKDSHAGHNH